MLSSLLTTITITKKDLELYSVTEIATPRSGRNFFTKLGRNV